MTIYREGGRIHRHGDRVIIDLWRPRTISGVGRSFGRWRRGMDATNMRIFVVLFRDEDTRQCGHNV